MLDYADQEATLEASSNPFALAVLAYLKTRATRHAPDRRFAWKLQLFKLLYQRGYAKADILELTRFIDWIMVLPHALEKQFDDMIVRYEEEQRMQYVTSFERHGIEKGKEQGLREAVLDILQVRFQRVPETCNRDINTITDHALLKELLRQAATLNSVEEFMPLLETQEGKKNSCEKVSLSSL